MLGASSVVLLYQLSLTYHHRLQNWIKDEFLERSKKEDTRKAAEVEAAAAVASTAVKEVPWWSDIGLSDEEGDSGAPAMISDIPDIPKTFSALATTSDGESEIGDPPAPRRSARATGSVISVAETTTSSGTGKTGRPIGVKTKNPASVSISDFSEWFFDLADASVDSCHGQNWGIRS